MIEIKEAKLEKIATRRKQYPPDNLREIAFVGRSNVGKSSLLNYLCGRKSLAKVSGTPGKTRTINFYRIDRKTGKAFRIVDLPGYGYAKVAKNIQAEWEKMMNEYFTSRKMLCGAVQLVDIRHRPTQGDIMMSDYLQAFSLPFIICATKADKLSNNKRQKAISEIRKTLVLDRDFPVIAVSSLKRTGGADLLACIEDMVF